jgi:LAO/AO transport system kinase
LVVLTPNLGDGVQMIKAGILEIADIFVVNKADLEGHHRAVTELRSMLSLSNIPGTPKVWKPPIIATSAARQEGIDELWAAIESHRKYLTSTGRADRLAADRFKEETAEAAAEIARDRVRRALAEDPALAERLLEKGTPYATAEEILDRTR